MYAIRSYYDNNGKAVTGLQAVDSTHPAYNLDGMDNIILLYTRRYSEQPLVVKGAGAGPGVTRITSYNVCYTKLLRRSL